MNIYLVFHISLLELVLLGILLAPVTEIELVNPNIEYKIKEILNHKQVKNYIKYLVKWTDYLYSENTWETKIILKSLEKFAEYRNQYPKLAKKDQAPRIKQQDRKNQEK
jgi:hypothetical protein